MAGEAAMTVRIPAVPDASLSPNARSGKSGWARHRATADLRHATALAIRDAAVAAPAGFAAALPAARPVGSGAVVVVDWLVAWPRGRRRKDDDAIPVMVKPIRDELADYVGINDRRWRTGRIAQQQDPEGLGWVDATMRIEAEDTA